MGVSTDEVISNIALMKMGQKVITDLDDTTDTTSVKVKTIFAPKRRALLRKIKTQFAALDIILGHVVDSSVVITGASQASPVVITAVAHGFSDDDTVSIVDVVGMTDLNGKKYTVANKTADTFELESVDGSDYTAYASAGTVGKVTTFISETGYLNAYSLPSDYLIINSLNGEPESDVDYRIKSLSGAKVLFTDDAQAAMEYTYNITDPELFDDSFVDLFAAFIAAELAYTITNSKSMAVALKEEAAQMLQEVRSLNSQERGNPRQVRHEGIIEARDNEGVRGSSSIADLTD